MDRLSIPNSLILGDVPPPPPEIPILDLAMPHPIVIAIVGVCLSLAAILFGVRWLKVEKVPLAKTAFCVGAILLLSTVGAAVWAGALYKERRSNWSSPRPIPPWQEPPVQQPEPLDPQQDTGGDGDTEDVGDAAVEPEAPELEGEVAQ